MSRVIRTTRIESALSQLKEIDAELAGNLTEPGNPYFYIFLNGYRRGIKAAVTRLENALNYKQDRPLTLEQKDALDWEQLIISHKKHNKE